MARKTVKTVVVSAVNADLCVDNAKALTVRQETWEAQTGKVDSQRRKVGAVTAVRDHAGRFHGMTNVREVR